MSKRNFWLGLIIGCVSTLLVLIIVGAVQAQTSVRKDSIETAQLSSVPSPSGQPIDNTFTYQGVLKQNGTPISATCSMTFTLFDAAVSGNQVGNPIAASVQVKSGLFTQPLNFATTTFNGYAVWLDIQANCGSGKIDLGRQAITAAPYALTLMPGAIISGGLNVLSNDPTGLIAQGAIIGIKGISVDGHAVIGTSTNGIGIDGVSSNDVGVQGSSENSDGVFGESFTYTHGFAAVSAYNSYITGTALAVHGGIQVSNAGINSNTPIFTQKVITPTANTNICASKPYATVINNPLVNNNPNAILIVTPNYGSVTAGAAPPRDPVGVFYDDVNTCGFGAGRWAIYNLGIAGTALITGQMFNVMVVSP